MLEFKNVSLSYFSKNGETLALNNLSFKIKKGELVSIVGPSGCGKTTILSLISELIKPSSGSIELNNINNVSMFSGYMFQKDHLFDWRTIEQNILLGLELIKSKKKFKISNYNTKNPFLAYKLHKSKLKTEYLQDKNYTLKLLKKYGLWDFKNKYPNQLSGGMRQRVSLIRTMALKPEVLLLDEPFSALDYQNRLNLCDDVYKIIKSEKKTAILVTHDISEAISMSDRVIVLSNRPATVKNIHEIKLTSPTPLKRREEPEFRTYFNKIWEELV